MQQRRKGGLTKAPERFAWQKQFVKQAKRGQDHKVEVKAAQQELKRLKREAEAEREKRRSLMSIWRL